MAAAAELPTHVRLAVIGGGVVGCSILYHLAKKGWKDCILLERRELSCGSSWHAAGQFHIINSNANLSDLQLHTLKFYPQLQEESGVNIGLHRTGGIYFASTAERLNYLKRERAKNRRANPDMEFISLAEAKRLHPLIDEKQFIGALYDPLDGYIDPASVVQAFAAAARKLGGRIFLQTMVERLTARADGGWRIGLAGGGGGEIDADIVVNAGGLWAREVGRMAGVELPLLAMEHHYLITEGLDEIRALGHELPSMVDFDGNAYGRQEGDGMLLGTYEEGGMPWAEDGTPWDFGHELLPNDLERIGGRLETAFEHFPPLKTAGVKKVVNGPFTFAPDGNALIGPVPGLRNFWSACAVMAGYCQGAGIGRVFADWVTEGEAGMDIFAMDVARFGDFATRRYTREKVIENFGRRFMISYPNEELPAFRPWRTTGLYEQFLSQGAVFGASFGLEHVLWFAPSAGEAKEEPTFRRSNAFPYVGEEVNAVRNGVGLIETANFAKYDVVGENAGAWLDGIVAGRLPQTGRMRLSPLLSPGGKLLGDLSVARLSETHYFIVGSMAAQQAHMRWFAQHLPAAGGVSVNNRSAALHGIAIAGPKSRELLARLTREDVSAAALRFMDVRRMEVGGVAALVARVSFTGCLGYEIYCTAEEQLALYKALTAAGEDLALRPFGARALLSMRLEKHFGVWAADFREDFTPQESGLERFVDAGKAADFIGKQAFLAESAARRDGARVRVVLAVDAADADAVGDEPLLRRGVPVGFVTSGGYGHTLGQSLAMGYVDADVAETDELAIEILGEFRPAVIQPRPLVDPDNAEMRG